MALLLIITLTANVAAASLLETPESLEKVQTLVADNLVPTMNIWREWQAQHGGRKLTMQHFLLTVREMSKTKTGREMAAFWGIKNNRLFRPRLNGSARYDPIVMRHENVPNKDSAEWSLLSLWLALQEAMDRGVKFPDCLFLYNALDLPMCNKLYPCHTYRFAPPISVIGYNRSLLPELPIPERRLPIERSPGHGDFVISHFRFTGHSGKSPSIHPHHPTIVELNSKGDPEWSQKRQIKQSPVPWDQKQPQLFFRGKAWCSYLKQFGCPRIQLANLTARHTDELNIFGANMPRSVLKQISKLPVRQRPRLMMPMCHWAQYKYLAALDGIGASSRTIALFHLGSLVVKQRRTPYTEWFYNSVRKGVHQEEFWHSDEDAVDVVHNLRANDEYARRLAEAGTAFAQDYLVKEVMMVYAKRLLEEYVSLFSDMSEYMESVGDPGNSTRFRAQYRRWRTNWRTVFS
ncbi:hypothetical protein DUNSADRAFT_13823 [Dunaliella salina]|uniref:Glycosyl transferase CAP10 domain-containing protein n=1 Tax=Dunaliella salina TaxID=3046 RepID=A0ABQ7G8K8_DUNSA|nr:hypothetical protein DUNSADRAFT_13823 [Dunaliella salina]|eukprot:KAF5830940.1 hypothetical protein DUNSADRAFT_13823 [Dunaliella salina]